MTPAPESSPVLPPETARLFAAWDEAAVLEPRGRALLIGRLLEDGDRRDLRWLVKQVGEAGLRDWLSQRGDRQLSRRSRAYWSLLLGADSAAEPGMPGESLWPL